MHCLWFIPWTVPGFLPAAPIPLGPCIGTVLRAAVPFPHFLRVPPGQIPVRVLFFCIVYSSWPLFRTSSFSMCRRMPESETPCQEVHAWHSVSRASAAVFPTPCSRDSHPGLYPSTADSALPVSCASSLGPQRYRSCILVPSTKCRARLAWEKFVSASPSHTRVREVKIVLQRLLSLYFHQPCSFSKRTAVCSATILVRAVRQADMYQCM